MQTIQAIGWHRPSLLLDQAWLEKPWKLVPKDPFDELLDVLLKLPEIFKRVDELSHLQRRPLFHALLGIIDSLWEMDSDLERWNQDFEHKTPGRFYETKSQ